MTDRIDAGDEPLCNTSANPTFETVVARRDVLRGGLAAAMACMFAGPMLSGRAAMAATSPAALLGFQAIPPSAADTVTVPKGYSVRALLPWGTPITADAPDFAPGNSGADQAGQMGSHHDGMNFFPIDGSSSDGLLVLNHEYVEPRFMHASAAGQALDSGGYVPRDGKRPADEVLREINAHGISVVRIRKQADSTWQAVRGDRLNRRVTGATVAEIGGPVRGSRLVVTRFSPTGERTRGTLNNCAHGVTPWNTYLTCEENWAGYFTNTDQSDQKPNLPREHARYGVRTGTSRYGWELADSGDEAFMRFDASTKGASPADDFRNEPNTFGWVVEIDPFDPASTPIKRTALGRFAHEGVVFQPAVEGQPVVCYSGDDARFEYIYKFVSAKPYAKATAGGHLLDDGTLSVAKFNADGSGQWLPLVHGRPGLTTADGFADQADVLVNTRAAADAVGATKMDRPEWGAVDPATGAVYFTLTNNSRRGEQDVDAANPRAKNTSGHIVRWTETAPDAFAWDLFLLAGGPDGSTGPTGKPLTADNMFVCPDGLWFDADRRLWIQTDVSESVVNTGAYEPFGNNQMLACDPDSGDIRRFLTGPIGQEITGVVTTPDLKTMFVNVQHPGATTTKEEFADGKFRSSWPDGNGAIPRSATLVITKDDGGVIGS